MKRKIEIDLGPVPDDEPHIYTCSMCGKSDRWGPDWSWFGSWKDIDDGKTVVYACSVPCRQHNAANNGRDASLVTS